MYSPRLRRYALADPAERAALLARIRATAEANAAVLEQAREIIAAIRSGGDAQLIAWTQTLDGRSPTRGSFEIALADRKARAPVAPAVTDALRLAADRIRAFHEPQRQRLSDYTVGASALRVRPLARVGLYVPGGTARYPSSVLMTAIPARLAGVREIIMVTPGASAETLAVAEIAGVDRVFEIGGAQAIAALAYGTGTVPRVDKIVGPGNQWVAAAKRLVFGAVDIDSIAGPSEVFVLCDDSARAEWVAADLLAQAEHDKEARVVLCTTSEPLLGEVEAALERQLASLPRKDIAAAALTKHGVAALAESLDQAIDLANEYAPEHLGLVVKTPATCLPRLENAGAIFVGEYSLEAAGDYAAGPNHVLPTAGAARFASPLGVYDFCKMQSVVTMDKEELASLRGSIETLAGVEGLEAHGRSVAIRFGAPE